MSLCAVCPKKVREGLLMCAAHWRLVPADKQRRVYTAWVALGRTGIADKKAWSAAMHEHRAAKHDAIGSVADAERHQAHGLQVLADLQRITDHSQPGVLL